MDLKEFEGAWKDFLKKEDLAESPGAAPDKIKIGRADEIDDLASVDIRGHIRLGDRLRLAGKVEAGAVQYEKALEKEPSNPVALTKLGRALNLLGRKEEARRKLAQAVKENPNYAPAFLSYSKLLLENGELERAREFYLEGNALNPFDPEIHEGLAAIYKSLGDLKGVEIETEALRKLAY